MKRLLLTLLLITIIHANPDTPFDYPVNTYKGHPINRGFLASKIVARDFNPPKTITACVAKHADFLRELSKTPHPLNDRIYHNTCAANEYAIKERNGITFSLMAPANSHIMQFHNAPQHVIRVARLGHRIENIARSCHAEPHYKPIDFEKTELFTHSQGVSRFAYFLAWQTLAKQKRFKHLSTPPTHLVPLYSTRTSYPPSDETHVIAQECVHNFTELKGLAQEALTAVISHMTPETLQEIYDATSRLGLWDMRKNLGMLNGDPNNLCLVDIEQCVYHKPKVLLYQGKEGRWLAAHNSAMAITRFGQTLRMHDQRQFERWHEMRLKDDQLYQLHKEYNAALDYDDEESLTRPKLYEHRATLWCTPRSIPQ